MDLSFPPFDRDHELVAWPADLAALMVGVAARQGVSPTAIAQAQIGAEIAAAVAAGRGEPTVFTSENGAFNAEVAAALTRWKDP